MFIRRLALAALCGAALGGATLAQDDPQQPVPVVPVPQVPEPLPPTLPPPAIVPGAVPPNVPGGQIPTAIPGGGMPIPLPGASPGAGPVPSASGAPQPPLTPGASPAPGGAPAAGGGGAAATFRVTQERLLGPIGAMRERGRTLFHSKTLGRASLACATCHRPDDLRAVVRVYPRFNPFLRDVATLEQAQNACLTRFMRGSPLPYWSRNAVALSIYLVGE